MTYEEFLLNRLNVGANSGFEPNFTPDFLFDFQRYAVQWAIIKGRGALFEDCGLGKTPQQLVWAKNVFNHTGKPVLVLTPLAVSSQTVREAHKFGIECEQSRDGKVTSEIVTTNYEKLHLFDPSKFSGVVCDESSILKNFDGARKDEITNFMRKISYRLLCTATAAPNDFVELGTSSEALGYLGFMDMLQRFFKNENSNCSTKRLFGEMPKWRFKGHAEIPFWRWVTSWALAIRNPSDVGFDNGPFVLPELIEKWHQITPQTPPEGMLFNVPASRLPEQRAEKRATIEDRCQKVLELVDGRSDQCGIWCQLNDEGDYLEKIIPDSVQISGKDSDERKEECFIAFQNGEIKNLITKPKIGAWGMNWQNCHHVISFPSHSYEQHYQLIRRYWRFGQKVPVEHDIVLSDGEVNIMKNLRAKHEKANSMFSNLVDQMNNSMKISTSIKFEKQEVIPSWL